MPKKRIEAYFAEKEADLVEAICRLVRIPSTRGVPQLGKPFGEGPAEALEEALRLAEKWGLMGRNLDGYVGVVDVNDRSDGLHILAHLDVVAAGPDWTVTSAFTPKRVGDLLYGRGTADNKGPLIAALLAMKAVKDLHLPLNQNVRLILGTDEESGMEDIAWYYAKYPYAPHAFSPDANFPVINVEKGHFQPVLKKRFSLIGVGARVLSIQAPGPVNMVPPKAEARLVGLSFEVVSALCKETTYQMDLTQHTNGTLTVTAHGKATHASTPKEGENALTALISFLCQLPLEDGPSKDSLHHLCRLFPHGDHEANALGLAQADEESGELTLTLSVMDWTERGFDARFDARTPLCTTEDGILLRTKMALAEAGITLEGHFNPAHHVPADSAFVKTLLAVYERYSGRTGACLSMGGGTYVHNIPGGVAFGATMPEFVSHLHEADECISISQLLLAAKIFTQVIAELCA